MEIELLDIENPVLEVGNMGGADQNVYAAPQSYFAEFATIPLESGIRETSTMNKLTVGQDRLKPGRKLIKLYNTLEKVSLDAERQGEIDGISHKVNLKLFTPGLKSESLALLLIPNQNWIFYVKTGSQMFRVGGPKFAAKLAPEGKVGTGEKTADSKGNEMVFNTYEVGFAPEVVDIAAIDAMVKAIDEGLTVVYYPAHAAVNILIDVTPTITFAEAVINADTLLPFTNQEIESILTLKQLDVDGNQVADIAFNAAIAAQVVTVTPNADLPAASMFELKFDANKILSADTQGRVNGSNYMRFVTA